MSARPERRRSSFTGASPIAPPPVEPAAAAAPSPEPQAAASAAPASTTVPVVDAAPTGADKPRSKYPPKVSFYQSTEDTDRIRGAIMHTIPYEGIRTLSQFLSGAAMKEVERLEIQYNGGKPFPQVGARELPRAARWGSNKQRLRPPIGSADDAVAAYGAGASGFSSRARRTDSS
ncbi:hypothetical protein [Frigoribacterium sp. NPDC087798]|uniref:ParB family protein n=1 Tax=Frigoribacterium sp. NPDC087798 TaxID=3363993 RepID=UPI00380A69DD